LVDLPLSRVSLILNSTITKSRTYSYFHWTHLHWFQNIPEVTKDTWSKVETHLGIISHGMIDLMHLTCKCVC
jgi:hypothetical protein